MKHFLILPTLIFLSTPTLFSQIPKVYGGSSGGSGSGLPTGCADDTASGINCAGKFTGSEFVSTATGTTFAEFNAGTVPATPSTGKTRLWTNTATNGLELLNSSGISTSLVIREIPFSFDGGGSALSGSMTRCSVLTYAATILGVYLIADQAGNATVDITTVAFASYTGAASASSITAAAVPALATAITYSDTTLTGWTKSVAANTVVCIALTSPATLTWISGKIKLTTP